MLGFLLGRGGVFADREAQHRYINQLREAAGVFDHLQSRRCGLAGPETVLAASVEVLPVVHLVESVLLADRARSCSALLSSVADFAGGQGI